MVQRDRRKGLIHIIPRLRLPLSVSIIQIISPAISRGRCAVEGTGKRGKQCGVNTHERSSENIDFFLGVHFNADKIVSVLLTLSV